MIKKIKNIKNIAVFNDFTWDKEVLPDFKKYNAFYGWNGTGKTIITRIFSAFENAELVNLELEDDSTVIIETDSSTLKLSKNNPILDSLKNNIRVFNKDFVNKNLQWEEGKASSIFIIGKEQIEKKEELNGIIKKLNEISTDFKGKKKEKEDKDKEKNDILDKARNEIKNKLREVNDIKPKSGRAKDYINYTVIDVENILKQKETLSLKDNEIFQLENSLKEKEAKELIDKVEVNLGWIQDILDKLQEVFKTIVPEEGLRLISDIEESNEKLRDWLRVGYEIHKDKQHPVKCEFCKNEISEERLKELGEYFSDVLRNLIKEIEQVITNISSNKLPELSIQKSQFYSEFQSDFLNLSNEFNQQVNITRKELYQIKNVLSQKKNNPSQIVTFDFSILENSLTDLKSIVEKINSVIKENNEKTNSFKEKRIEYAHKLESAIIDRYKTNYKGKINEINELEEKVESLRNKKEELEERQKDLEQKLKEHHFAAEEFNKLLETFMGRSEIVFETVDEGYTIKRNGRTANNLSEGEQSAIALIYFLIKLKEDNFTAKNGIVIIDDPVSSFDSQYLYGAFGFIKEKIKELNPQQVFIFTHQFSFFRLVRDWMRYEKNNFSFYMIKSKINSYGRHSIIEEVDNLLKVHNSEYPYLFKLIHKRANSQDSNLEKDYIFPNLIRKFLENYISFKIPIEGVNIHIKFQKLCEDYPDIDLKLKTRIESFCQDQSHPLYQESTTDFDERLLGEIQQVCSSIVELIEKTDPKHYQHLLKEVGN